jgi:DNA-binding MarR family transcriptional regulator
MRLPATPKLIGTVLDDLEAARLIERRPDSADRRARRIVATQLGTE